MAGLACWRYLTDSGGQRLMVMVAFLLFLASIFQTVITFFGNWRWIPLTGLGVPLLSIGISSMLAPTLAIALLLVCNGRSSASS
jgi:cell division protein FtsW (lipid II flippase)